MLKSYLLPGPPGITVCAIGTSFPNAVASVLMAQQNKPAAAIANALGSNVQNVFLAMALPWVFRSGKFFLGKFLGKILEVESDDGEFFGEIESNTSSVEG